MPDWSDQIAEYQRQWTEQQQHLLNDWLKAVQGAGTGTPPDTWQKAINAIEQQVNNALDAQKQSLTALAKNAESVGSVPEPFTQWVQQMEQGIGQWSDIQQRLWKVWFDMLRSTAPTGQQPGEIFANSWRDMMQRATSIQTQWLSGWPGQDTHANTRKKAMKTSASRQAADTPRKKTNKGRH